MPWLDFISFKIDGRKITLLKVQLCRQNFKSIEKIFYIIFEKHRVNNSYKPIYYIL